jgi:hypothetical protein
MRRVLALPLVVLVLLVPTIAIAQTEITWQAHFRESFGRGSAPSGIGRVVGFGKVTETFQSTGETETGDAQCPSITTGLQTNTFADGSTLTTSDVYFNCFPGQSQAAPGAAVSFGNPSLATGTWTVAGGTGTFAGATGGGTLTTFAAGDVLHITYDGTVVLDD